jgi:tetratricopeptide (TPR) repeat protein
MGVQDRAMRRRQRLTAAVVVGWLAATSIGPHAARAAPAAAEEAALKAHELARFYYDKGDFREAAKLFHRAFAVSPRAEFLYNAARAEQRAAMLEEALRDYRRVVTLTDASDEVRRRSALAIKEIEAVQALMARKVAAQKAEAARRSAAEAARQRAAQAGAVGLASAATPPEASGRWGGWTALLTGTALAASAGGLAWAAADARATLDARLAVKDGYVQGDVSWAAARAEADRIGNLRTGALVLGGVGGGLVALGSWLLLRRGPVVALVPARRGVRGSLAVRF